MARNIGTNDAFKNRKPWRNSTAGRWHTQRGNVTLRAEVRELEALTGSPMKDLEDMSKGDLADYIFVLRRRLRRSR